MRFSPQFLDEIRARLPVSQVVARKVALKKKGREFAGLSPFKTEKTPSFFVNDQKGFYHCFASGEHGDIFTFLIKTEGLSFPEAVERLAEEAGIPLPKDHHRPDPERESQRARLLQLMTASEAFFRAQLFTDAGRAARDYLATREIDDATIAEFGLGYAPNSRTALRSHLARLGYTDREMILAGMVIGGEDIATPYDRFRHRIIFPIHDAKARVVAFGGRALSSDQPAKYLNSPETPLFHKGNLLYNAHRARQTAFDLGESIAVEGYMDAIALSHAGYANTVAPLGTALTPEQIHLLWRMAPEPILCFDGDAAGLKAAYRAVDTALPLLKPGYSLRFAFLADGLDPDDLIRQQGPHAIRKVLDQASPLAEVLWQREWAAGDWSTPERRAGLEARLNALVSRIADPAVKAHYGQSLRERLRNMWQPRARSSAPSPLTHTAALAGKGQGNPRNRTRNYHVSNHLRAPERTSSLKSSSLVAGEGQSIPYREALLIRTLINHPWLLEEDAEIVAELDLTSIALSRIRDGLLALLASEFELDSVTIRDQLGKLRLSHDVELVDRLATHKSDRFAEREADSAEVEKGWRHTLALHNRRALYDQLAMAEQDYRLHGDDDVLSRIVELQRQISASIASEAHLDD